MKITRCDDHTLELAGISGGGAAVVVPIGLAVVGGLAVVMSRAMHARVPLVVGAIMIAVGVVALMVNLTRRETVSLDLGTRRGRHREYSVLFGESGLTEFGFEDVAGVEIGRGVVRTPGRGAGGGTERWTVRLLLRKPRRAIVLAETQGGAEQRVRPLAETVARAVGVSLIDGAGERTDRARGSEIGAPLAGRTLASDSFGVAPEGARMRLSVIPAEERVELEWKTVGGPALPVLGLAAIGFFALISTAMALQATGAVPVLSWIFGASGAAAKPAPLGIMLALVSMCAVTWLGCGLIVQTWLWSWRRVTVTPEAVCLVAVSPLARAGSVLLGCGWATRWSMSTGDVRSVRTREDAVEVRDGGRTRRFMVHLPCEGEVVWAAKVVRTAAGVLGRSAAEEAIAG